MADNIQIVGNILASTTVSRYSSKDNKLIPSETLKEDFGGTNDYIEFYIYDAGNNLLNINYNYLDYYLPPSTGLNPGVITQPNTTGNIQTNNVGIDSTLAPQTSSLYPIIEIDPVSDLQNAGYTSGEFKLRYNLFQNKLSNFIDTALYIKEISPDRTELRLASISLTNDEIESVTLSLIDKINNSPYYVDYLLNFGENRQAIAINIALNKDPEGYQVLIKLYESLPAEIQEKDELWIVEEKVSPYLFDINLDKFVTPAPPPTLRGPNLDIPIPDKGTVSTAYTNYSNALLSLQSIQSSSYNQILNLMSTQSIQINVDYTDFNNFVFFGSSYQRVVNFYNKVKQIEDYTNKIAQYTPYVATTASLQTEINTYSSSINLLISQFDGYESYLYFESSSYTWPKSGSLKPYKLLSTGSAAVLSWYPALTVSASLYDNSNYDNLIYAVPEFIKDDDSNAPFLTFLNMVGQYFDNIWIYLKAITDVNLANNNLNKGISKDLVYEQLKSLGIKLYNSQAGESVDQFLIGANTGSSTWDNNTTITGSFLNNIPRKDLLSELYKRIYHNLPLLLKTKGTVAGLDYLMTTFGVPNETYYTITSGSIQTTWYTPTGSSVTASILNVKEFGGGTKVGLINGYNNDKVRILPNPIAPGLQGSVLSPLLSLQTYPTASSQFRENDMNYVDISFSPETQIDTYASGAIASNNPTWSLDDYIGDPRQQYNSSYPDLDAQRTLYYQTGVSGFPGFTGSLLDYNGFIRLIQFFDNALFKMLEDFTPERTSLSTGVTINSPVLERNKVSYANPTTSTTQSVYEAKYPASTISSQYGKFYNNLSSSNDTVAWYDGELSGSEFDIHHYFTEANYNPYLLGNYISKYTCSSWVIYGNSGGGTITYTLCDNTAVTQSIADGGIINNLWLKDGESITATGAVTYQLSSPYQTKTGVSIFDINNFNHTDFNVLLNNVSKSVSSIYRQNIEYIGGSFLPTSSILFPAELQDSYLSLRSYNISRYEGSKTTSLLYNTYTDGDDSYGKTAAIDHSVRKIGIFTQIESSSLLPRRNSVRLKYLVDEFGSLTELNQINKNWWDVQRTFIMGNTGSVALFDNKKYSNQKATDGNKLIFDSGYTYSPVLYGNGYDTRLYFDHTTENALYQGTANFLSSSYYISGSSTLGYPIATIGGVQRVSKLYNNVTEDPAQMTGGTSTTLPCYTVPEGGAYQIDAEATVTMKNTGRYGSASFTLQLYKGAATYGSGDTQVFEFTEPATTYSVYTAPYLFTNATSINYSTIVTSNRIITASNGAGYYKVFPAGSQFYKFSQEFYTVFNGYPSCNVSGVTIHSGDGYIAVNPPTGYSTILPASASQPGTANGCAFGIPLKRAQTNFYMIHMPGFSTPVGEQTVTKTFSISFRSPSNLSAGDKISASLNVDYIKPTIAPYYTASINPNSTFRVTSLANSVGNYPFTPLEYFADPSNDDTPILDNNQLAFSTGLSSFYSSAYQFLPYYTSGSRIFSSSLYSEYGDVDYPFQLGVYDIFSAYDVSGSYFETRITNIETIIGGTNSNYVVLTFADDLPPAVYSGTLNVPPGQLSNLTAAANKPARFLFLKRLEDETNIYLKFNKRPGLTSYGFIIPKNLAKDVLNNIDTITKEVKQKLLADQQGTTS